MLVRPSAVEDDHDLFRWMAAVCGERDGRGVTYLRIEGHFADCMVRPRVGEQHWPKTDG